jgi:hypothetical protein
MLKYILAAATALTIVATSAQSANVVAAGYRNGVEVAKTDLMRMPGIKCQQAVSAFSAGVEVKMGTYHRVPLSYMRTTAQGVKIYSAITSNGINFIIACTEDGVYL